MKILDKVTIAEALVEIKYTLGLYNKALENNINYSDDDYEQLKKAFDGVDSISKIIRHQ